MTHLRGCSITGLPLWWQGAAKVLIRREQKPGRAAAAVVGWPVAATGYGQNRELDSFFLSQDLLQWEQMNFRA